MRKWFIVGTLAGAVDPPEPVDEETARLIEQSIERELYGQPKPPQWIDDGEYRSNYIRTRRA